MAPVMLALLTVLIAATVMAQPSDDLEEASADSIDGSPTDSLDTDSLGDMDTGEDDDVSGGDDEEAEGPARPGRGPVAAGTDSLAPQTWSSWLIDTSPSVNLKIDRKKDVTNWDTKINLNRHVSSKLRFTLGATLHTQENRTLNRSDSNDGTTASLKYQPAGGVSFSLRYNSAVTGYRYDLSSSEPAERRRKQNVSVTADLSKNLTSSLGIRLGTSAGTTRNSYASVSNEGSQQDLSAALNFNPMDDLKASVSYNARRLLLDSQVDSSGTSVFSSKDRTFSQDLGFNVKYEVLPGIQLSVDASQTDNEKQNPDPNLKQQETENRSSSKMGATASFNLLEWLTWSGSGNLSESRTRFRLRSDRDNFIKNSNIKGSAKITPWRGATVNLGAGREETRSEYNNPDTGSDVHKSVSFKITQDLGPKVDVDLTALSDIVSVFYDDKEENPKDRDRLNNRISMNLDYKPAERIGIRLGGEYSEDQTSYIKAERSGNNRTNRRYRLSGNYDLKTFYDITLTQDYDVSALYSLYQYTEESNTLVRNSNIDTRLKIPLARKIDFNINHSYQFQDQGKYSEEGGKGLYARSSEKETHRLVLVCRYAPIKYIGIVVRQTYRIQTNWSYDGGEKSLDYETATSDISGRLTISYDVGDASKFSLKLEQNNKEGSNVNKAFKNYRNIEIEASHTF